MSVCEVFRVSIVYWLGGGRDSCNRRYLTLRASTKNSVPAGNNNKDPKTPKAYDQERSLCSQLGIQSLRSPLTPKITTAINPDKPTKLFYEIKFYSSNFLQFSLTYLPGSSPSLLSTTARYICHDVYCRNSTSKLKTSPLRPVSNIA